MSQLSSEAEKGRILPSSTFCSVQALSTLDDVHPYWGGQSCLLSPLFQMLTLLRNNV